MRGLGGGKSVPPASVVLQSDLFTGQVAVGVVSELSVLGVDFLMGYDIAGGKVHSVPVVSESPVDSSEIVDEEEEVSDLFPVCAVTRSMSAQKLAQEELFTENVPQEMKVGRECNELDVGPVDQA